MRIRPIISLITLVVCVQIFLSPIAALAQSSPSDDDAEIKRRKELAAALEAEAKARKAAADATSTELGLIKSNTTVDGAFVENNIAASKALGCAANDIKLQIDELHLGPNAVIVLNSAAAMSSLSEYTAFKTQVSRAKTGIDKATTDIRAKLEAWMKSENEAAAKQKAELEEKIKKMEDELGGKSASRTPASSPEMFKSMNLSAGILGFKYTINNAGKTIAANEALTSSLSALSVASAIEPVSAIIGTALNVMAMFKTDVSLKGTSISPQQMEIDNYIYRLLQFEVRTGGGTAVVSRRVDAPIVISPDRITLTNETIKDSPLLISLGELSASYVSGKKVMDIVATKRKQVLADAAKREEKERFELAVKLAEKAVETALDKLAADPTDRVLRAQYDLAVAKLANARLGLDAVQKKIDEQGTAFDKNLVSERSQLESLLSWTEALEKRFAGPTAADQKTMGDYLRSEVLSRSLDNEKKKVYWLEATVMANGANQRRLSSPIIDVFTRGPGISYSGGAVVGYQLRESSGTIKAAGTVWAYAPYRKSKNIRIFECQGIRKNGDIELPFQDL